METNKKQTEIKTETINKIQEILTHPINKKVKTATLTTRHYNEKQAYNKKMEQTYKFTNKEATLEWANKILTSTDRDTLKTAWSIIEYYNNKLHTHIYRESELNYSYGKPIIHLSERSTEELQQELARRNKEKDYEEHKQQEKLTTKRHITELDSTEKEDIINKLVAIYPEANTTILKRTSLEELQRIIQEALQDASK